MKKLILLMALTLFLIPMKKVSSIDHSGSYGKVSLDDYLEVARLAFSNAPEVSNSSIYNAYLTIEKEKEINIKNIDKLIETTKFVILNGKIAPQMLLSIDLLKRFVNCRIILGSTIIIEQCPS